MRDRSETPRPSYVPEGYALRSEFAGFGGVGFLDDPSQATLTYTTNDWNHFLMVHVSPNLTRPTLAATGGHQGLEVPYSKGRATYYDGIWSLGSGLDQRTVGAGIVVHWSRVDLHSIVAVGRTQAIAVTGSRRGSVELAELIRTLESIDAV